MRLITDRTEKDVLRWKELRDKGWAAMSEAERGEWMGDPIAASKAGMTVNLMKMDKVLSEGAGVVQSGDSIIASVRNTGVFLYARVILGAAEEFENQTVTLSCEDFVSTDTTAFRIGAYWADTTAYTIVSGAYLRAPGRITFNCGENTNGHAYFSLFIYAATSVSREAGATVEYKKIMVEFGATGHEYVPYSPIVATSAIKGMYGHSDMNRVETAVEELTARMKELGYLVYPTVKTDWTRSDLPTVDDMQRYYQNVLELRSNFPVYSTTPAAPTIGRRLDYSRANDLEKILFDIDELIASIQRTWFYSGDIFAGEV